MSGFNKNGVIAEFSIPALVNTSTNASALNEATFLQNFRPILDEASGGNPQNLDRINGMALINGKLIVNSLERYDNDFDTHTTLVVENPSNIANSAVTGYYSLEGAAHAAGWISAIPSEWQSALGGSHITGNSSRYSINGRLPMGITAFAFNPSDISGTPGTVPTTTLLDFSLANPLYTQYEDDGYVDANYNLIQGNPNLPSGHIAAEANLIVGTNDLWTEESQANYGFIVPGTRTYLTIGSSAGHNSGIGYKPSQDNDPNRQACNGPCSYDSNDYYNYYWLWDVNDLVDVRNGEKAPHDILPYSYGVFDELFRTNVNPFPETLQVISGGTYDADNGILYLSVYDGASTGAYDKVPAIVAYKINGSDNNCPTAGTTCNDNNPNTTNDVEDGNCNCSGTPITPPTDCELLANTDFDNLNNWEISGCTVQSINGVANITNVIPNAAAWEVRLSQNQQNITLQQGEAYTFTFRASADANRPLYLYIGMEDDPYTPYRYETVTLTPTMQEFSATFTMTDPTDTNVRFDFNFGGNATNTYIDFASLRIAGCNSCPSAGTTCNDNNPNTTNDVEDGNCNCSGTPINPPSTGDCDCPDLPTNGTVVSVSNITQLQNAINNSNGNMTIMVQPGDYVLNYGLNIGADKPNLTIMGATGNRDDVTLRGLGWNNSAVTHIFNVSADGFTVANMTLRDVYYHLIQIHSEDDADDFTAQNVRFLNAKEQLLKVSAGASTFSDRGRVLCCAFEFTAGIAYQNYTGGIDAHKSKDWLVQNNTFKGIRSPDGVLAEHAIHFWRDCEGTNVIGNQIERCDRGIGFGLGNAYDNGHRGGLIMNNFVHTNRDVGIGLEYAPDVKVYNNTVITDNYPNSIEYRFSATTNVRITNNLVSGNIALRDGASATNTDNNYTISNSNIFVDAANHDYHLVGTPSGIVDAGTALSEVTADIDCENRSGGIDIGADEATSGNNDCDVSDNENFESGWGIWNDGGIDVRRNIDDAAYANSGSYCARLIDNSGAASSIFTDALDMSEVTSVDIRFSYMPRSMENNEDFFLEFSNNNDAAYAVVGRWIKGRDFENDIRYDETVTISETFSSNTRFRFRCDASGNGDYIYIDDIIIDACGDVGCPTVGASCDDGNSCTTGSTYDTNCDCVGGNYTDADGDGLCIGEDPNDNDPCNPNPCNDCNVFDNENFDGGWGIWNDGGSDVRRNIGDATYANSGSYCIRLRDNSGSLSSIKTDALNMSTVTSVDISFSYIPVSMENNEDFFLEFSTDDVAYAVVGRWIRGRDFENGIRYNETITIDGPFGSNTRFRFRCDASGNSDFIYIDDVAIEACGGTITPAKLEVLPASISVNLYPNPANHSIQLDCEISENTQAQIQVYDNVGQLVKNMTNIELNEGIQTLNMEVSDLPTGMYFCRIQSDKWQTVKKFVIAR